MDVKLHSAVDLQMIKNNASKQFSSYKYIEKLGNVISIFLSSRDYSKAIWIL